MNNSNIHQNHKKVAFYGTTIYIGEVSLETVFGTFRAITFQDLIHKGYIVALVYGDLQVSPLYIRMHSSCITSECLRSMDCDCVEQLEGAMHKISEKGHGILFYLLQEGRGSGYVAKSRDRMIVQYHEGTDKEVSTFEAYKSMGMKKDYRDYRNIKDICHILDIMDNEFVLITNNPDKIEGFKEQGLKLSRIESIDISPGPFNIAYLKSKEESGHLIFETKKKQSFYQIPHERVQPFDPFVFKGIERFIFVSSYFLPIKPINNQLYFNEAEYTQLMDIMPEEEKRQLKIENIGKRFFVQFPIIQSIQKYGELAVKPYWFQAHVFYDVAHSTDYIVLTHGFDVDGAQGVEPIVRIQSESIFDRFPLKTKEYKQRYKDTVKAIVRRGKGLIMILYNDGRGTGLGHRILDMAGIESGITKENRDFVAVSKLLKLFLNEKPFQLFGGITSYKGLKMAMTKEGLDISSIFLFNQGKLEEKKQDLGIESIRLRVENLPKYIELVKEQLRQTKFPVFPEDAVIYATGVGTSQAHARFLNFVAPRITFKSIQEIIEDKNMSHVYVILFSQGLSPNINMVIEKANPARLTVVTTIREGSAKAERVETYLELKSAGAGFIHYEEEVPDNTLVRVQGPIAGYFVCLSLKNHLEGTNIEYTPLIQKPSEGMIREYVNKKQVLFVVPNPYMPLVGNIAMKFLEGAFSEPAVFCDQISFSHGYFQYALKKSIPIVFVGDVKKQFKKMVDSNCLSERLDTQGLLTLLELQIFSNFLMIDFIEKNNVDQINWIGKEKDKEMYNVKSLGDL